MSEFINNNGWVIWSVFAAAVLLSYRLVKRGGNEPFLRRALYAFNPNLDLKNPKRRKLRMGFIAVAVIIILVIMLANFLFIFT